jgi:GntR family transcriptional regulator
MTSSPASAYHPSVPLHHQIQRVLRSKIETGEWSAEEKLPTEMELARRFRVSRNTIREALASLEHDGLIVRHRRRGTFVHKARQAADSRTTMTNLVLGYEAKVSVIRAGTVPAPAHVVSFLKVARGQPLRQFVRTEAVDGKALAVVVNYMTLEMGRRIRPKDLRRYSLLEFLRDRLKIPLGAVRQLIEARMPDDEVASLLGIDLTQPVLFIRAMVSDKQGNPIEIADNFYRADRYHYESELPLLPTRRVRSAR